MGERGTAERARVHGRAAGDGGGQHAHPDPAADGDRAGNAGGVGERDLQHIGGDPDPDAQPGDPFDVQGDR